jgi:superfamily II DNA/RNA helicase
MLSLIERFSLVWLMMMSTSATMHRLAMARIPKQQVLAFSSAARVRRTSNRAASLLKSETSQQTHNSGRFVFTRSSITGSDRQHMSPMDASTRLFSSASEEGHDDFFSNDVASFESMGIESPILLERLKKNLDLSRPTQVQASSFQKIREGSSDVTIGAETGSGKTLAYLLPLMDDILQQKQQSESLSYDYARALILVPNKELVQQVLRMAIPLSGGDEKQVVVGDSSRNTFNDNNTENSTDPKTMIRLAVMPGGLSDPLDFRPFRDAVALGGNQPPVDLLISTPAAIGPLGLKPTNIGMFADIKTLVIDEADMLLDGGYIRPLENVLMGFRRADRLDPELGATKTQHVFCAATLPDMGLRSVDAYLQKKFPYADRIQMAGMHNARHYGLAQATAWHQVETKKERMESFTDMLETPVEKGGLQGEKVMVFLNSVEDVEGAHDALERAGISSVPYHAKIALGERATNLDRFRRYDSSMAEDDESDTVPILVCTDLASRGLDVPGVNVVVQLQFSGNVVSHLHRMGRCGRAGQRNGRGIVFYTSVEAALVAIVRQAEEQQEKMMLEGDVNSTDDENEENTGGKVKKAFSRKRGFTKKIKKLRREAQSEEP